MISQLKYIVKRFIKQSSEYFIIFHYGHQQISVRKKIHVRRGFIVIDDE